ncbi:ATP-binding protein [Streptomyces sp. NPDC048664]|uniref:ATP-binding protein n=1 Tax=Streptomyces sp. NPDC048664 TaxID=3154505 RepID=UPI00343D39F2
MISQPSRQCTVELQALPSRIGQVRRIVSAQLRYWHLDPLIDRAALGVTELLTNVHLHAQPDKTCTVELELLLDRLTVSVHDHDPRLPVLCDADVHDTGGRGLAMVAAVSDSWGARPDGESGKVVWFTLPAPSSAPARRVRGLTPYEAVLDGPAPVPSTLAVDDPLTADARAGADERVTLDERGKEPAPARSAVAG